VDWEVTEGVPMAASAGERGEGGPGVYTLKYKPSTLELESLCPKL